MLLGNYFDGIHKNYKKLFFSGISFNTRSLKKNNIFFAIKGNTIDGNKFISKAIEKGSKIIVTEQKINDLRLQAYFKKQELQQGAVIDIEV